MRYTVFFLLVLILIPLKAHTEQPGPRAGWTPLMKQTPLVRIDEVKASLETGADVTGKNKGGARSQAIANIKGHTKKAEILSAEMEKMKKRVPPGMVRIPAGEFFVGLEPYRAYKECKKYSGRCKKDFFEDEGPVHRIMLEAFYLDKFEVTQLDFERVMGENPSKFEEPNLPVERVTWQEAKEYCEKIDKRLPTEAEWEKAAKGRADLLYPWGDHVESGKANFCDLSCGSNWKASQFEDGYKYTAPVGSYAPNGYGLYDMAGNVWEWVADWYGEVYYKNNIVYNPKGPSAGGKRALRGGSWKSRPTHLRIANRSGFKPSRRSSRIGFRCAKG